MADQPLLPPPAPAPAPTSEVAAAVPSANAQPRAAPTPPVSLASLLALIKPFAGIFILLALMVAGLVQAGRWLLQDADGTRWLLARLGSHVQVSAWQGALLDPNWSARSLRVQWDSGRQWVLIENLQARSVALAFRPHDQAWLGLGVDSLKAERVTLNTGPKGPRPIPLPDSMAWPLQLQVRQTEITQLVIDDLSPFTAVTAQTLALDPRPQARHSVQQARATWREWLVEAGGSMGHTKPYTVAMKGTVRPTSQADAPPWASAVQLHGPLETMKLQATLRGVPLNAQGNHPAPALELRAGLRVLQAWPLDTLQLQTEELNLQALHRGAPRTSLSGSVQIDTTAAKAPVKAWVDLRNRMPGAWDQQQLPLRQLRAEVVGRLDQRQRLDFSQLDIAFGDTEGPAGRWTGHAVWQGGELKMQTRVEALTPHRLDRRAARMQLSGPFNAILTGLPAPDGSVPAKPRAQWQLSTDFDLEGRLEQAPLPVQLAAVAVASEGRFEIKQARARTGGASADFAGTLQRGALVRGSTPTNVSAEWQLQTQGTLKDFDPLPWWPGERNTVWHKGPHRLNAQWTLDLKLPGDATTLPAAALLQRLAGNGSLMLRDSVLAGLPLTTDINLGYQPGSSTPAHLKAEVRAAGNLLTLEGRGDPTGNGLNDRLRAELQAHQLQALAPWAALHPALADWMPQQGQINGSFSTEGRWPQLRTEGTARATLLRVGTYLLQSGSAQWKLDSTPAAPLDLRLDLAGLQSVGSSTDMRAEQLQANLRGTTQNHQIQLSATTPAGLAPALARALGLRSGKGSLATVQAQGSWQPESGGAGVWRGTIERVQAAAWDGKTTEALPGTAWTEARNLKAELQVGAGGSLSSLRAEPGSLTVLANPGGTVLPSPLVLRWDEVLVDLRPERPYFLLRADLQAFEVVPYLARLQPTMGWLGHLKVGGRLELRAAARTELDLVLQRTEGDLNINSNDGVQLLGVTDMRLALTARDGLWQLTPVIKGRGVGDISGLAELRTAPERRWLPQDATLQGSISARAADIGIWAAWVPAGWRLTGAVNAGATLAGTLGSPRYTGAIRGNQIGVRNLLQGVNVSSGDVSVLLEGETARIERFTLKGGDGSIEVTGSASWADTPTARLQLKADQFRALGRVDRQLIASGQASLNLQRDRARLEGRFKVDEGLFDTTAADAPSLDSDVSIKGQAETEDISTENPAAVPRRNNFALAIDVNLGEKLRVRGRGLDGVLAGEVRITNPEGRLAVNGSIRTVGGTYAAYGQKLELERGVLTFTGPPDNPRLDVLALRPNIDNRVGVLIAGPAQTPRVRLYAEPEMSDPDKLSWLVLGRAPDGLGRSDTALLQRAAVALLSGEGEAPTDTLLKSLGIDELSLRQGDGEVRETVITLGKQLSRRWYVGYERGVNAASGTWQLIYRIAQRFTLRAQSGLENSLDMIWVWRVQETPSDASMRKLTVTPK